MSKYKIWHIPQVPGKAFEVETDSLETADLLLNVLGTYDLFQYAEHIKPDYANASGIMEWNAEDGDWEEMDDYDVDEQLGRL